MFRWLIEQRYVLANPFAGIKVRGSSRSTPMDEGRVFSEGEWAIIRAVASSTAIETGKSARQLETVLRDGHAGKLSARLRTLALAK